MRIILVGGGMGGLAAALALASRGLSVTVLEQAPEFAEVGAGLQLSPNATRILAGWGLEGGLRRIGFAPEAAEVGDAKTQALLLRTPLGAAAEARWGAPYLQLHRADLQSLLLNAARGAGATVRSGAKVESVSQDGGGVTATLVGGERIEADVLIGCDGINSAVRAALWGLSRPRFSGQTVWRGGVPAERLPSGLVAPNATVWVGVGRHFVHYFVRGGELVNFVGAVEDAGWTKEPWIEEAPKAQLLSDFDGWPEPVRALIEAVDRPWRWALFDRPPLARWSKGRMSLLGDAAHPMLPFLAQGAAMAIEDAEALARRLTHATEAAEALAAYERERWPRTAKVQAWSRRNALLFHLPPAFGRAAFAAARLADHLRGASGAERFDWLYGYRPPAE